MGAETRSDRLRKARLAKGYGSAADAARAFGWNVNSYSSNENGNAPFSFKKAEQYARAFGVRADWLYSGHGDPGPAATVPLVGYVGAGAVAHFYEAADLGEVEAPVASTDRTVAVEIRGESLGPLFESWLVYYDDIRAPVTSDLIGRMCVVWLVDGRVLVKRIRKSAAPGRYHLESNIEGTLFDQEVEAAARVKTMTPR